MFRKLSLLWRSKDAKHVMAFMTLVLFAPAVLSAFAIAQTGPTVVLPGNGAPILVTPQVHLTSAAPSVGASNATPGNTVGATNATASTPLMASDLSLVPQYSSGPAYTTTITPTMGVAPSTPVVHLGTPRNQIGATTATASNTVGATSATNMPVMPTAITTVPEYTVSGSIITITPLADAARSAERNLAGETPKGAQQATSRGFDRGVGQSSDLLADGNITERSLGAIAREYRSFAVAAKRAVRTNDDVAEMNVQPEVPGGRTQPSNRRAPQ
jgi:hypothetical protein